MHPSSPLEKLIQDRYGVAKTDNPAQGRRKWLLRVAREFWDLSREAKRALELESAALVPANEIDIEDADPCDDSPADTATLAILVRTDFSNESAWNNFYEKLQEGEKEITSFDEDASMDSPPIDENSNSMQSDEIDDNDDDDDDNDDDDDDNDDDKVDTGVEQPEEKTPLFRVVNPPSPNDMTMLAAISNLKALRLFNDVDIRKTPPPPQGTKRINPGHPLVDLDGWQEIYKGKPIWIYDEKSNTDQCARLVSQQADMYGAATGDSWRARVTHICELQVNLSSGMMSINFGGLDRWDFDERQRNLEEANSTLL